MKYGLSEKQLEEITAFIAQYPEVETAVLFGSRALGTFREASDVDIALQGEGVTFALAAKMKFCIEEDSYLPFMFDFVAYPTITNEGLRKHIDWKGVVIFRRGGRDWREYILEDVIDKFIDYRGKTPKKTEAGIPLVTAKIVKYGRILEPNEFIAEKDYDSWMTRGLPEVNDVVLTTEAPLGEVALIKDKKVALAQRIITLRGDKAYLHNPFLKYYLQSETGQYELQSRASGTTVFGIKAAILKKMPVFLPPLPEQKAIASVLSCLDDKIDLLHRQNKTLEAMAETLFRQWFVEEAQEDWEEVLLGEYISVKHGYAFKGTNISTEPTNLILITPGNFRIGGGFKFDKFKYYTSDEFPKDYIFQTGDLIVTMTDLSVNGDTLGYPALVPETSSYNMYLHNQRVGKVLFKKEICKYFLYYLMKTEDYQWFILSGASGTSIRHTSPSSISSYSFRLPPNQKILEFEKFVIESEEKNKNNQNQIFTLKKLRDTLLPKLMGGEVRVEI